MGSTYCRKNAILCTVEVNNISVHNLVGLFIAEIDKSAVLVKMNIILPKVNNAPTGRKSSFYNLTWL